MTETPPQPTAAQPGPGEPAAAPQRRFRDRLWGLRALVVVALVSVLLGGLAGAALAGLGEDHHDRFGPGHGFQRGDGPMMPPGREWRRDRRRDLIERWMERHGTPSPVPEPAPARPSPTG